MDIHQLKDKSFLKNRFSILFLLALSVATFSLYSTLLPSVATAVILPGACSNDKGPINVRDFGAIGDGVINDTAALQAAADCISTLFVKDISGRAVAAMYMPSGTYKITSPVTFSITRFAMSYGGVAINGDGPQTTKIVTSGGNAFTILTITGTQLGTYEITIKDIGFNSTGGGGAAIEIKPDNTGLTGNARLFANLFMDSVDISGAFDFGLKATGLVRPVLDNVHMNGNGATTCFFFGVTYNPLVQNSSCSGAITGIDFPASGEGETVIDSFFKNVGTAIRMHAIPGNSTGPSPTSGWILRNTIEAKTRGLDIQWKAGMQIMDNIFRTDTSVGNNSYEDIYLANNQLMIISDNRFVGAGTRRKGIVLEKNVTRVGWDTNYTISNNTFGSIGTGVLVGTVTTDVRKKLKNTHIFGNTFSGTVTPVVDNGLYTYYRTGGSLDTTPPTVSLTAPANGATVSGTIPVSATASDNVGVVGVQFKLDGVNLRAEDTTSPYSTNWNTASSTNGSHTLVAVVRDAAGNRATSSARTVTVSNTSPSACTIGTTVNVKDFGAVGDGAVDDTTNLQNAMNCLKATLDTNGTATLYFPPGTYLIKDKLALVQGAKPWQSLIVRGDGEQVATILAAGTSTGALNLQFNTQVPTTITNMTFMAWVADAGNAITVAMPPVQNAPRSLILKNIVITSPHKIGTKHFIDGVRGTGLTNPLVDTVHFAMGRAENPKGGVCVRLDNGYGMESVGRVFCNGWRGALDIAQRGGDIYLHSVQFGVGVTNAIKIKAGGGTVRIVGPHLNPNEWGIDIADASSALIQGIYWLHANPGTTPDQGYVRVRNSNNVKITRNIFFGAAAVPTHIGVDIGPGNSNVEVMDNTFTNSAIGVRVAAGVSGTKIIDNLFVSPSTTVTTLDDKGTGTIISSLPGF